MSVARCGGGVRVAVCVQGCTNQEATSLTHHCRPPSKPLEALRLSLNGDGVREQRYGGEVVVAA